MALFDDISASLDLGADEPTEDTGGGPDGPVGGAPADNDLSALLGLGADKLAGSRAKDQMDPREALLLTTTSSIDV